MAQKGRSREASFYYADNRRIQLEPSRHFVAVRSDEVASDPGTAANGLAGIVAPDHVLTLPEHGLVVLRLPDGQEDGPSVASVARAAESHAGVAAGPAVYEPLGTDVELGLIATGRILVRFDDDTDDERRQALLGEYGASIVEADGPGGTAIVQVDPEQTLAVANELHEMDGVEYAEPDFVELAPRPMAESAVANAAESILKIPEADVQPMDGVLAGDPFLSSQWGLTKIRAQEAWAISMGTPNVTVAVLDEGCDTTHEDLVHTAGWDAHDNDADPRPSGNDAHGTACAGIVGMMRDNGKGGAGVAPRTRIVPIRIAKGIGGGYWSTSPSIVATGIYRAVALGASVLSNSYSLGPSSTVTNAFKHAATAGRGGLGCVSAAATGNGDVLGVIYPASLSPSIRGLLAVGASNQWDQRKSKTSSDGEHWWGSNFGPEVDVVAPGVKIMTTDIMGSAGYGGGHYTSTFNGTSSATPHVAGLAALILAVDPQLRNWEVEEIIKRTARELGAPGRDQQFGFGRIDARRALEAASKLWYQVSAATLFLGPKQNCFMRLRVRMYNPGINTIRLNALTVRSHTTDWSAELDRFEYRPTGPSGNVLRPHTTDDVVFDRILLPANGTRSGGWATRWSASWSYTFWRPSAPGLPLDAGPRDEELLDTTPGGSSGEMQLIRGSDDGEPDASARTGDAVRDDARRSDVIDVDRDSGRITIVIQ